jgi:integrase
VRFAAYTGLRAGEIAALRVGRLDMLRRRVEVAESLSIVPGQGLVFRADEEVPAADRSAAGVPLRRAR